MKKLVSVLSLAILLALGATAQATLIEGSVAFSLLPGATVNPSGGTGLGDATGLVFAPVTNTFVQNGSGAFVPYVATNSSFSSFTFAPFTSGTQLWTFTSGSNTFTFVMDTLAINNQGALFLDLSGFGTISGTGYEDTGGSWTLNVNKTENAVYFAFSSTTQSVPEPASLFLLGAGLLGLAATRRKLTK